MRSRLPRGLLSSPDPGFRRVIVIHYQAVSLRRPPRPVSAFAKPPKPEVLDRLPQEPTLNRPTGRTIGRSRRSERRKHYDSAASRRFVEPSAGRTIDVSGTHVAKRQAPPPGDPSSSVRPHYALEAVLIAVKVLAGN